MYSQNQSKVSEVLCSIAAVLFILLGLTGYFFPPAPVVIEAPAPVEEGLGSAALDGGYSYSNITSANASSTAGVGIRGGAGVLGHINIASSSPAVTLGIRIYDGTATSTGTLIGTLKPSSSEQTFTFDVAFKVGLILDVPVGYNGSLVISYK